MSKLDALKAMTLIVADTGDLKAIAKLKPVDATTNPSLLLKVANSTDYDDLIVESIARARSEKHEFSTARAAEYLAVMVGCEIAKIVPGRVSTEIDARLSFDSQAMITAAQRLIALYEQQGIQRNRVLIKIACSWEGIKAAEYLEKQNIQCNLTLLFNLTQAKACAEAGVFLISPFVGRIYDYYKAMKPDHAIPVEQDPGVISVKKIFDLYRKLDYKTIVMGASFRTSEQVLALAGCDRLTVSPSILETLTNADGEVLRQLHLPQSVEADNAPNLTESDFRLAMCKDPMANTKLAEGIAQFCEDQVSLEALLDSRMREIEMYENQ